MKWETSVGSTVELAVGLWYRGAVVVMHRDGNEEGIWKAGGRAVGRRCADCDAKFRIELIALVGFDRLIVDTSAWSVWFCV